MSNRGYGCISVVGVDKHVRKAEALCILQLTFQAPGGYNWVFVGVGAKFRTFPANMYWEWKLCFRVLISMFQRFE